MQITSTITGDTCALALEGRLDTITAPELETALAGLPPDIKALTLDLAKLDYVSSAGLRIILAAQKQMNKKGAMVVRNVNDVIMEIFDITGFVDILTIE